jgi:predicted MFS family arabinose efflux permease
MNEVVAHEASDSSNTVKRIGVGILGAAAFVAVADVRVVNPLLPIIAHEFNTDIGTAGFMVTAYTVPFGVFQLVYGPLGDYWGKIRVMSMAMVLFAIGTAACAIAPSLFILELLRLLTGIAAAAIVPLALAYIGDNFAYQERQLAIGKFLGAVALGNILSTSMGGIVGDFLNWRLIFLVYGLLALGIFVVLRLASRNLASEQRKAKDSFNLTTTLKPYLKLLANPASRLVILATFGEGVFFFGGFAYLGSFLRYRYDLSYLVIGLVLTGFGLGSLVYSRSVRKLVRFFGENGLMFYGGLLSCVCYLVIAVVGSWEVFTVVDILLGLSYYMLHSTLQTKATELAPGARGTAVSLFAFSLFLGQGLGAIVIGAVVGSQETGYTLAFAIAGVAMGLLGIWIVRQTRHYNAIATTNSVQTKPTEDLVVE